uniref:Uncharacterized protein n=1 Tax=viral metagenome TaxID=1070528 RepID=A0A6M3JLL1_9ZZZZ
MKTEDFLKVVKETIDMCISTLIGKDKEYARNDDKFHNFKRGVSLEAKTPEKVLRGMMTKHVISIYDYIDDLENGIDHSLKEWDEKLKDNINYLLILRGLLIERYTDKGRVSDA